jgi:hypothetical protein
MIAQRVHNLGDGVCSEASGFREDCPLLAADARSRRGGDWRSAGGWGDVCLASTTRTGASVSKRCTRVPDTFLFSCLPAISMSIVQCADRA